MRKVSALAFVFAMIAGTQAAADDGEPYVTTGAKKSHHQKVHGYQRARAHWQDFGGIKAYDLNGKRALFFAQLRLKCTAEPKYVKIRLARILDDGSLDTTGTNTWVLGVDAPKNWSGTFWWESMTEHPIKPQFKVVGGKCHSFERQFKFWQP